MLTLHLNIDYRYGLPPFTELSYKNNRLVKVTHKLGKNVQQRVEYNEEGEVTKYSDFYGNWWDKDKCPYKLPFDTGIYLEAVDYHIAGNPSMVPTIGSSTTLLSVVLVRTPDLIKLIEDLRELDGTFTFILVKDSEPIEAGGFAKLVEVYGKAYHEKENGDIGIYLHRW